MKQQTLLKSDAIRGLAIIMIFLHNYCHWLGGIVRENEYTFNQNNVDGFFNALAHPSGTLFMHIVSFWGHYGVPLFLFLSAYWLEKKYGFDTNKVPFIDFFKKHFKKLFLMMIVGFVAFTFIDAITPMGYHYNAKKIIAQLTLTNNFMSKTPNEVIWPGPYWFFGLMMQLYIVYRIAIYKRHWAFVVALVALCFVAQVVCGAQSGELNYLRYNFVGAMLPFGLGILFARYEPQHVPQWANYAATLAGVALMLAFSLNYITWFFVPIAVCAFGVGLTNILPTFILKPLNFVGTISAALFVCHPITRKVFIVFSRQGEMYGGLLLYIVSSIVLAIIFKKLIAMVSKNA